MALGRRYLSNHGFRSGRLGSLRRMLAMSGAVVVLVCIGVVTAIPGSSPAFADTVVDGCTIVANPTPSHFTNCPTTDFSTADLSGVDLSYADLAGSIFAALTESNPPPSIDCVSAKLRLANLHDANVSGAAFTVKIQGSPTIFIGCAADLTGATLTGVNASRADLENQVLTNMDLSGSNFSNADFSLINPGSDVGADLAGSTFTDANFSGADLPWANLAHTTWTGADLTSATLTDTTWTGADLFSATLTDALLSRADFSSADLLSAEFTGTVLVPPDLAVAVPSPSGGVVAWPTPPALPGATPGACTPPSGSSFAVGTTQVTCAVVDAQGRQGHGTFVLNVSTGPVSITTTSLPPATVGAAYSVTLSATGGHPPYSWKLATGSARPPRGLKLDRATGVISGTPTKSSTSTTFTVEVLDTKTARSKGHPATRNTATGTFTIAISP